MTHWTQRVFNRGYNEGFNAGGEQVQKLANTLIEIQQNNVNEQAQKIATLEAYNRALLLELAHYRLAAQSEELKDFRSGTISTGQLEITDAG